MNNRYSDSDENAKSCRQSFSTRIREVVKLRVEDIDTKRNMIHIKVAKGQKDRYTVLSEVALEVLREYWRVYQPNNWLFPG